MHTCPFPGQRQVGQGQEDEREMQGEGGGPEGRGESGERRGEEAGRSREGPREELAWRGEGREGGMLGRERGKGSPAKESCLCTRVRLTLGSDIWETGGSSEGFEDGGWRGQRRGHLGERFWKRTFQAIQRDGGRGEPV